MITIIDHDHDHDHHASWRAEALSRRGDAIDVAPDRRSRSTRTSSCRGCRTWCQTEGATILRCKGILSFKDDDERFVFQGVHMMLEGDHQRDWKAGEKRESKPSSSSAANCPRS